MYKKWMDTCIKTRVLTDCYCAGSGEEGVMEDVKREKCVQKVDGNMYKSKEYLLPFVVQVVVKKVSWRI